MTWMRHHKVDSISSWRGRALGAARQLVRMTLICVLMASFTPSRPAHAAVYVVDRLDDVIGGAILCTGAPNDCSLRAAIITTNLSPGADTITLPAGTYTLTIPGTAEDAAANGDLDITDDLTINGAGSGSTVIDGNGGVTGERVLHVTSFASVTLNDLTIQGGMSSGRGGGIANAGTLTLNNCALTQNDAGLRGGGVDNLDTLSVNNCDITGNTAVNNGGGIFNYFTGQLSVEDSLIDDNHLTGAGGTRGGGIYQGATGQPLTLTDTDITGNSAGEGGGIALVDSTGDVTLLRTTLSGNSATGPGASYEGGGLYFDHDATAWMIASTIADNDAPTGGGIYIADGTLIINDSTISGNMATDTNGDGGGIYNRAALNLTNSTISGNSADDDGGGIYQFSLGPPASTILVHTTITNNTPDADLDTFGYVGGVYDEDGSVTLANSIIADNDDQQCFTLIGSFTSLGTNLSSDGSCNLIGPGDLPSTPPMLHPLADNGGDTLTHALMPFSPAIDSAATINCASLDQRGVARPIGTLCDIGAYEAPLWIWLPLITK